MQIDGIRSTMTVSSSISNSMPLTNSSGETKSVEPIRIPRPMPKQTKQELEKQYVEDKHFSDEDVIGIIEKANKNFTAYDRRFEFSIHEATKQIMVKVIDANTDEVIRELPPEKVLDMVAAMWEVAGIIVDRKI